MIADRCLDVSLLHLLEAGIVQDESCVTAVDDETPTVLKEGEIPKI